MHDPLEQARELARHLRETHDVACPGGVVIVFDGFFVGHAAELPPAAQWAAGCLPVAVDGSTQLARPVDFRGGLEWADLGEAPSPAPRETTEEEVFQPATDS